MFVFGSKLMFMMKKSGLNQCTLLAQSGQFLKGFQKPASNYKTVEGTGVRGYIHVVDLAVGHIKALEKLESGFDAINLGTGHGTSVLQMIKVFENSTKQKIPYEIIDKRPGDVAISTQMQQKTSRS